MEKYIGIVLGKNGEAAAVVLEQRGSTQKVAGAYAFSSGRYLALEELVKKLPVEQSEVCLCGCYFDAAAVVELEIPHELSSEEVAGMVQIQMGWQIPLPGSEVVYHYRRLESNPNIVRVAAIRQVQWRHQMDFLLSTKLQADIVTSPLIGGDMGVSDGNSWSLAAFEPDFSFGLEQVTSGKVAQIAWTDTMRTLMEQAEAKKEGTASTELVFAALQMALLASKEDAMFLKSVQTTLPLEIKPMRYTFMKRFSALMALFVVVLLAAMGARLMMTAIANARQIDQVRAAYDAQIIALQDQNKVLEKGCKCGEEVNKALPNGRFYGILANMYRILPEESYIDNVKSGSDGSLIMTVYGLEGVGKFREAMALIPKVVITSMPSAKNDRGVFHTVTIQTRVEDESEAK